MMRLDAEYPGYGFASHKGYSTPEHLAALRSRGHAVCVVDTAGGLLDETGERAALGGAVGTAPPAVDQLAADEFGILRRDSEWLLGVALASEACALLGDRDRALTLYEQILPFERRQSPYWRRSSIKQARRSWSWRISRDRARIRREPWRRCNKTSAT